MNSSRPGDGADNVVFIGSDVPDLAVLLDGLQPGTTAYVLDSASDGVAEVATILERKGHANLESISIVAHGAAGEINLGPTALDAARIAAASGALADIGAALTPGGALQLYSCHTAAGASGAAFLDLLSSAAGGVNVVASTGLVGAANEGGSWLLDAATASIGKRDPFTARAQRSYRGTLATPAFKFNGVNYVGDYYGAFENADNLTSLRGENVNSAAITADFGINGVTDTVYDNDVNGGLTESDEDISSTISQAVGLGVQVMYRPLIDFLGTNDGSYSKDQWRADFNPGAAGSATANAFFASYQSMIVGQAKIAQAAGASIFSIGLELDQITGPAYKSYWDNIITAVRAVFSGSLTYGAIWDDSDSPWQYAGTGLSAGTGNITTQVSFWNELDYVGIDEYAPISNLANPTVAQLIDGWTQAPTDDLVSAVTGGKSLMSYYEGLSASIGKPLLFTEIGYGNSSDAAINPASPGYDVDGNPDGATADPTLQANLYTAFVDAWTEYGNGSLEGAYAWEWEPSGADSSNVWDINGLQAETALASGYASTGTITFGASRYTYVVKGTVTNGATYDQSLTGFVASDRLDIKGLTFAASATASLSDSVLTVMSGSTSVKFLLAGSTAVQYVVIGDGLGGSEVVGLAAGPLKAVSQFTADKSSLDALATGFFIFDSAANVGADFAALNADTHINEILLYDAGTPTLTLSATQVANDTSALGKIENSTYAIAVSDSASDVTSNLAALADNANVSSIHLTDAGTPTLTLTASQAVGDASTLAKISNASWTIVVRDSAAHVATDLTQLDADASVSAITLTDSGTPELTLTASQLANDTTALGEVTNELFEVLVGTAATYYAGGNGEAGAAIDFSADNSAISEKAGSNIDVTGSDDYATVGSNSEVDFVGEGDVVTGSSGDIVNLSDSAGNWDYVSGSNETVNLTSAQATVDGGNDTVNFSGGSGDAASFYDSTGNWDAVYGSKGTIDLNGAEVYIIGADDAIDFQSGAGNAVSLYDTGSVWGTSVDGSDGTIYLNGAQALVIGADDTIYFEGADNAVSLYDTGGVWGTSINGSDGTIYLNGAQALVIGADDAIYFEGAGNAVSLYDTGGVWGTSINGSDGTIYLNGAQALVIGADDTIYFEGAGNAVSLYDTGGVWGTSINGSNGTIYLNGAQALVIGADDTINFEGAGNAVSLYDTGGVWGTSVDGSNGTIYLNGAQALVIGADDAINFEGASGNAVSLYGTGTGWGTSVDGSNGTVYLNDAHALVIGADDTINFEGASGNGLSLYDTGANWGTTVDGSDGTIYLNNSQANLLGVGDTVSMYGTSAIGFQAAFGLQTVDGFASTDSMRLKASDFANWTVLSSHITQSGANAVITLDASDKITLAGVTASSLTSAQFHFV